MMNDLTKEVTEYLNKIYAHKPNYLLTQSFQNEVLDIVDEIYHSFNGSFQEWLIRQKEQQSLY